ncbi:cupin-like domain-containing protein [Luteibacter aegosomaticola]|uniref:cupin-like domain-containing protein n=1 Tax=Luteibacter aegosomaticola TaxID=2911538 RepID=UPI001FFB7A95|nr:cupin-like domain-containing protein [Luteibacter aegosomaticola]UPG89732.1 cupin-like domain-containing protein [Luteibacter aegosomaticola]
MEAKEIPVCSAATFQELIERDFTVLASTPFIIKGYVEQWPAWTRWRDHGLLRERFGHLPVTAGAPQFTTHRDTRMCQVRTDFATYLDYVADPAAIDELFAGRWTRGDSTLLKELGLPLYCGNLQLVRHARDAVFDEISPSVPPGLGCLNDEIPYYYQSGNHVWLYVSLRGALTPLHQDNNAVIAYLGQLQGEKEAILYSPTDRAHFYSAGVGYLDPLNPDDVDFPTWRKATPWRGRLGPGDLLIWGPNWAHHVVTLSDSITVSHDMVSMLNLAEYAGSADWRGELGHFARKHADLVRARTQDKRLHALLDDGELDDIGQSLMAVVLANALKGDLSARSRATKQALLDALDAQAVA